MMTVRPIEKNEIHAFATLPTSHESFVDTLEEWIDEEMTQLAWCHAFEEGNKLIGRIVYAAYDDALEVSNVLMDESYFDRLPFCLTQSMELMSNQGFDNITYHLYDDRNHFEAYLNAFEKSNFAVTQQKKSFIFNSAQQSIPTKNRLTYKTIGQVDESFFLKIFEEVTLHTLDRDDQNCVYEYGGLEAAKRYMLQLKDIDYTQDWWLLAFDNDVCIGLVIAQRFSDSEGAINYLGVLPPHRGKGYSEDLILEALRLMKEGEIDEIIADIDDQNHPLDRTLTALAFEMTSTLYVLNATL